MRFYDGLCFEKLSKLFHSIQRCMLRPSCENARNPSILQWKGGSLLVRHAACHAPTSKTPAITAATITKVLLLALAACELDTEMAAHPWSVLYDKQ